MKAELAFRPLPSHTVTVGTIGYSDDGYAILDSHCHAWRRWPYPPLVPDEDSRGTIDQLLYEMDTNGIEQALVVCAAIEDNPDNVEYVAFRQQTAILADSTLRPTSTALGAPPTTRRAAQTGCARSTTVQTGRLHSLRRGTQRRLAAERRGGVGL